MDQNSKVTPRPERARIVGRFTRHLSDDVVPDDVVPSVEAGTLRIPLYGADVTAVEVRIVGGRVPLKVGERVELEVVSIERKVVER